MTLVVREEGVPGTILMGGLFRTMMVQWLLERASTLLEMILSLSGWLVEMEATPSHQLGPTVV